MMEIKDLNREKAGFAFENINQEDILECENFKSDLKNLPMYIYTNGLIATLLFILKKSKNLFDKNNNRKENSYKKIENILLKYIQYDNLNNFHFRGNDMNKFLEFLIKSNPKQYRRITLDIISILDWLVKFADGIIEDKKVELNG